VSSVYTTINTGGGRTERRRGGVRTIGPARKVIAVTSAIAAIVTNFVVRRIVELVLLKPIPRPVVTCIIAAVLVVTIPFRL
jgi:hypothetical protein